MAGLGEILQQARLERGVSVEEAERATHIARRYLQALEAEDLSAFPAPVFARGFLRNYSQYLGLDPVETVSLWPDSAELPEPVPETSRDEIESRLRPMRERGPFRRTESRHGGVAPGPLTRHTAARTDATPLLQVLALVIGLVVSLGVIAFAIGKLTRGGSSLPAAASSSAPAGSGQARPPTGKQPKPTQSPPARSAGKMPSLVGKDAAAAIQQLQQAGVTPLVISYASSNRNDRPGTVVRQEPAAGAALTTNANVTLVVNAGSIPSAAPAIRSATPALRTSRPAIR